MKILTVLPTLNENKNIAYMIKKIFFFIKNTHILIIDDNSTDGTRIIIKNLKKKNNKINYIFRKKKNGIGSAHKAALKWAIRKNFNICITMDCDRTHNPIYIKKMLRFIKKNYVIINTNRFIAKDSLKEWSFFRNILTKTRFLLVKFFLKTNLDSSGGYRCYNLKKIRYRHLFLSKNNSYFFLIESLYFFEKLNYPIYEVPIILKKRTYEFSKMSFVDILMSILYLLNLKYFVKINY